MNKELLLSYLRCSLENFFQKLVLNAFFLKEWVLISRSIAHRLQDSMIMGSLIFVEVAS